MRTPRHAPFSAALLGLAALGNTAPGAIIYIDNPDAVLSGSWTTSTSTAGYYGTNYAHNSAIAGPTATYTPNLPTAGTWTVWTRWTDGLNRASSVPYTINYDGGSQTVFVNQETNGGRWQKLGDFSFTTGTGGSVFLNTAGTTDFVIADAVAFSRDVSSVRPAITAAAATASTTISTGSRAASRVIDGSGLDLQIEAAHIGTANGNDVNWLSASGDTAGWHKVDLGASYKLESMDVFNFSSTTSAGNDRGVRNFDLYVSNVAAPSNNNFATNPEWTLVEAGITLDKAPVGSNNAPDLINFAAAGTQARWVAFDITSNYGDASFTGLGEVRFYELPEPTGLAILGGVFTAALARRKRRPSR